MEPIRISPYTLIYVWLGIGFVAGLLLLLIGWAKGKLKLGALGLLSSTVGGGLLGIFLIAPVFAVFLWLIFRTPPESTPADVDAVPSSEISDEPANEV